MELIRAAFHDMQYDEKNMCLGFYAGLNEVNWHFATHKAVRMSYRLDSTRFIIKDSIVLVIEPQISLNLKSVPVGLTMYFGEGWMPK